MNAVMLGAMVLLGVARVAAPEPGDLFENVVAVLEERFYDRAFRRTTLPLLAARFRPAARAAAGLAGERAVVHAFLSRIPSSHLALYSRPTYRALLADLVGRPRPTLGFSLVRRGARFLVHGVWAGGPADRAGLREGDRVAAIDGVPVHRSPRLDWRSDDAALDDPPVHELLVQPGERVALRLVSADGRARRVALTARRYAALRAMRASARVLQLDGVPFGYVRLYYVHTERCDEILARLLREEFAACRGVILDLRGRGGSGEMVERLLDVLARDRARRRRPILAWVDRSTRSAKEVLAFEIRRRGIGELIGERSAGAVLPASFAEVGHDSVLMFPAYTMRRYTALLEGRGVVPGGLRRRFPAAQGPARVRVVAAQELHEVDPVSPRSTAAASRADSAFMYMSPPTSRPARLPMRGCISKCQWKSAPGTRCRKALQGARWKARSSAANIPCRVAARSSRCGVASRSPSWSRGSSQVSKGSFGVLGHSTTC